MTTANIRKRTGLGLAGLALASGIIAGVAPAANAAPEYYCPSGATCLWEDHYYRTANMEQARIYFQQCAHDFGALTYSYTNIRAYGPSSVYNNGNYDTVQLYAAPSYAVNGSTLSLFMRTLPKKAGDHNVQDGEGLIANFTEPKSGKFVSVSSNCRN